MTTRIQSAEQLPPIRCAKCGTIIKNVTWVRLELERKLLVKVECHDDTDNMVMDLWGMTMDTVRQIKDQEGIAFATQRLSQEGSAKQEGQRDGIN